MFFQNNFNQDPQVAALFRPILKPKSRLARFHNDPNAIKDTNIALSPSASPVLRCTTPVPNPTPASTESPSKSRRSSTARNENEVEEVGREKIGLLDLPLEILHLIGLELPFAADVFFLSFTCRLLHTAFSSEHNYFWYRRRNRFFGYSYNARGRKYSGWDFTGRPEMIDKETEANLSYNAEVKYKVTLQTKMRGMKRDGPAVSHRGDDGSICNMCCWMYGPADFDGFGKQHCGSCYRLLQLTEVKHQAHRLHPRLDVRSFGFALHPYLSFHGRSCPLVKATTQETFLNPPPLLVKGHYFPHYLDTPEGSPEPQQHGPTLPSIQPPQQANTIAVPTPSTPPTAPASVATPTTILMPSTPPTTSTDIRTAPVTFIITAPSHWRLPPRKKQPVDWATQKCDLFWHATLQLESMIAQNRRSRDLKLKIDDLGGQITELREGERAEESDRRLRALVRKYNEAVAVFGKREGLRGE